MVAHSDLRIESVRIVRCYPAKTNLYPTTSIFPDISRIEFVRIEFTYRIRKTPYRIRKIGILTDSVGVSRL